MTSFEVIRELRKRLDAKYDDACDDTTLAHRRAGLVTALRVLEELDAEILNGLVVDAMRSGQ